MMPLSQVLAYNTEHLIDAATHWESLADQREEVFATVRNDAYTLPWEGLAADALHERTHADFNTAMTSAENLRQAATIARDGASTLDQMHSRALYTIEDAQGDGFAPTEPLQFVDTRTSTNPAVVAQRQAQAQAYSGQLKAQVAALYTHDTQVGADMGNATAGEGKIQFVDHTFKTDGSDAIKRDPHPTPPQVITMPDAPGQGFSKCDTGEVLKRESEVVIGGLTAAAGLGGGPLAAIAGIGAGGWAIEDGIDALEKCK